MLFILEKLEGGGRLVIQSKVHIITTKVGHWLGHMSNLGWSVCAELKILLH